MNPTDLDDEAFALLQRCAIPLRDDASSTVKRIAKFYLSMKAKPAEDRVEVFVDLDEPPVTYETRIANALQDIVQGPTSVTTKRRDRRAVRQIWLQQYVSQGYFEGARGARLPIGLPLHADYQGHKLEAHVTAEGIVFQGIAHDNPSAAAVAAKMSCGASLSTAQSNGWTFWNIGKGSPQGLEPLSVLRNPLVVISEEAELAASIAPHPDSYSGKYADDDEI